MNNQIPINKENLDAVRFFQALSLRDYFAAKALQGLLAAKSIESYANDAKMSYELADAMIKQRNK